MRKQLRAWIALGIITIIAGLSLSMTNEVTKDVIKKQVEEATIKARLEVLPLADRFEPLALEPDKMARLAELYVGLKGEEPQGYVGIVLVKGYGGPVQVIAGVDPQGQVTGVTVGGPDFRETAGLGAKAKDAKFTDQYKGKQTPIKAVKSAADRGPSTIDAITAATITTNAVTGGVNTIASRVDAYLNPETSTIAEGTTYTASQKGFAGPVAVFVTVKDDGTITALTVGDEQFAETEGFGMAATKPGFTKQFVGKILPIAIEDIDAISGATYTTEAVVGAINQAYEEKNIVAPAAPEGTRYTASRKGFAGPVAVFVTVKDDGTITALEVGDEQFAETEGFGMAAKDAAFTGQFIGKTLPLKAEDIDAVSGATYTTNAVVDAINAAFEEKAADVAAPIETQAPAQETQVPAQETQVPAAAPEGTRYTASRKGFAGPVAVFVTVKDDGTITALEVGDEQFAETEGFGMAAKDAAFTGQFIGKTLPLKAEDIDAVSGATYTTNAVVDAVNAAYAEKAADGAAPLETQAPAQETQAPAAAPEGTRYTASRKGFAGPVAVFVTVKDDGTITALEVGDEQFAETEGFGMAAKDAAFTGQFIGKTLPLKAEDIDAVSGATYTTNAVVDAINAAYAEKAADGAAPLETQAPAQETQAPAAAPEGTRYTASRKGFAGPVAVFVTVKDDGTITALEVGDEQFAETEGFGMAARDAAFTGQFIGKTLPLKAEDIDAVSGATYTTNAVVDAVNAAYAEKAADVAAPIETQAPAQETQAPAAAPEGTRYTASRKGFAGPVAVFVTVKDDGTITALEVGDEQFAETEGFGMAARDAAFTGQFIGKTLPLKAEDIDAVSGATYTTNAVVDAINAAYEEKAVDGAAPIETQAPAQETQAPAAAPEGTRYTASRKGFAGPVAVFVTVKDDGTITALEVGDEQFAETEGFGMAARDAAFTGQFIGKTLPLKAEDIDAVSGATYTTNAVVDAVNAAYAEKAADGAAPIETQAPAQETQAPAAAPEGTRYTASRKGFAGPVAVFVTVKDDGTITALEVGDEQFAETEGFGMAAKDAAFTGQFIGKTLPLKAEDIDAVSGATYTTNAVVDAINAAYAEKAADGAAPLETQAPAQETQAPAAAPEGTRYTASRKGFAGPVAVFVTVKDDGTITALEVGDEQFAETEGFGMAAKDAAFTGQFIGKTLPLKAEDIDAVSGATYTTNAVVDAINAAYEEKSADGAAPIEVTESEKITAIPPEGYRNASAYAMGYADYITVTIDLNNDNTIASLKISEVGFAETQGLGSRVREEAFIEQFIGKLAPLQQGDVDLIAGATLSSQAVIKAINKAAAKLQQ